MRIYEKIPDDDHRLIHCAGDGFVIGGSAGSAYHFIRTLRRGGGLATGVRAVGANAPRIGGAFAAYHAVFCAFETAISRARGKDDFWGSVAAGAACMSTIHCRGGVARHAVGGCAIGAIVHGIGWVCSELHSKMMLYRDSSRR
ncbi:hypothetical protein EJB05_48863, partial [Eragrostis curvula]